MIERVLQSNIEKQFHKGKAILVLGPRQVGKTTLIENILKRKKHLFLNGDDPEVREQLEDAGKSKLARIIGEHTLVYIDEAQRIPEIGILSKQITDQFKKVQLILSGSSALEIRQNTNEPLTGRKFEYQLYPISWAEFESHVGYIESSAQLQERLIFGMYPEIVTHRSDAIERLKDLTTSYLYKDVLSLSNIRKPELFERLLKALALQVGSEVSYNELSNSLEIDKATVARYIDLLENAFIIFRLNSFNRNQRNEIKQGRKIYFCDNGIRNAIINNFNDFELRMDKGALWENFLISERRKYLSYQKMHTSSYFWRTITQQEIDLIEERNGQIDAFEFKWKMKGRKSLPPSFTQTYHSTETIIHRENFRDFISPEKKKTK